MKSSNSYLAILGLFGVFLVVSTLQLGKSRTTLDVIQKQKTTTEQEIPLSDVYQKKQIIPHAGFSFNPVLMKSATTAPHVAVTNPVRTDTLASNSVATGR